MNKEQQIKQLQLELDKEKALKEFNEKAEFIKSLENRAFSNCNAINSFLAYRVENSVQINAHKITNVKIPEVDINSDLYTLKNSLENITFSMFYVTISFDPKKELYVNCRNSDNVSIIRSNFKNYPFEIDVNLFDNWVKNSYQICELSSLTFQNTINPDITIQHRIGDEYRRKRMMIYPHIKVPKEINFMVSDSPFFQYNLWMASDYSLEELQKEIIPRYKNWLGYYELAKKWQQDCFDLLIQLEQDTIKMINNKK